MNASPAHKHRPAERHAVLPRGIGVLIAAFGALLCWGALIGLVGAIN